VLAKASGLGWRELTAWSVLPQVVLALALFLGGGIPWEGRSSLLACASGVCAFAGGALFYAALHRGPSAAVVPLTSLYPALAVLLAAMFLHEAVSARQIAGIGAAFLAAVLLATE
jgi:uncharacterized membrane protein